MVLIQEDGTGVAGADAYVTTVYVDTYVTDHISAAARIIWDAHVEQDRLIREATRYIDTKYRARWKGRRANSDQGLSWPKVGVVDLDRYQLTSTEMPVALLQATAFAAYHGIAVPLEPVQASPSSLTGKTIKAGPVSIAKTFAAGGENQLPRFPTIDRLLRPFIEEGGTFGRA
ncbi:MAG: hypothetical protein GY944_08625 [bacterium]|nr:hypothetical protein [bacterium]